MSDARICRLCAQDKSALLDVKNSPDGISLTELVQHYLTLKVDITNFLICQECNSQLLTFHQFACQVHAAQEKLKKKLLTDIQIVNPLSIISNCEYDTENVAKNPSTSDSEKNIVKVEYDSDHTIKEEVKSEVSGWGVFLGKNELSEEPEISNNDKLSNEKFETDQSVFDGSGDTFESDALKGHEKDVGILKRENRLEEGKQRKQKEKNKKDAKVKLETKIKTEAADKTSKKRKQLRMRIRKDLTPMCCYICQEVFIGAYDLRKHQKSHLEESSAQRWPCTYCAKRFRKRSNAIFHIRKVHDRIYDQICHECGKMFCGKQDLNEHLLTHTEVASYECSQCSRKFKLRATLLQHLKTHETAFHQCPKCSLYLKSRRTFLSHLRIHDEIGKEVCPFCGKRFKLRKTLKHHLNMHTGERPYECAWCTKTFANDSNLRIHKKRVHHHELLKYEEENNIDNVRRFARHAHLPFTADMNASMNDSTDKSDITKNNAKTKKRIPRKKTAVQIENVNTPESNLFLIDHED